MRNAHAPFRRYVMGPRDGDRRYLKLLGGGGFVDRLTDGSATWRRDRPTRATCWMSWYTSTPGWARIVRLGSSIRPAVVATEFV
ncbi:hypothetical protein [Catellatospora chokoriensis]|uniref:Uncharacterized protein n=1 Tax=Catellatospora chokoriensis TaxID=310353 RepID=A0A8J3K308_9ACTN|nr:hypothetical protein [Catellatospora chokoriensis]GIF91928.1 hypothetical protein Cch02nite_53720 [Catellatospora chokoriensis]